MEKYTFTTASLRALEANFDKLSVGDIDDVNSFIQENVVSTDYVIDSYTSDDYWYRLYKSGWVEQGGSFIATASTHIVSLPIEMKDDLYYANGNYKESSTNYYGQCYYLTTTSFTIKCAKNYGICWEVKGFRA